MSASDTTLLTEHLTYRPAALIDDIINSINILAFKATDAIEKGLLSASPQTLGFASSPTHPEALDDAAKHEIINGVHQLETLLEAKIDKNFDKFEVYALRNIYSIPPEVRDWVRLSHYEGLDFESREGALDKESVLVQRRKLREVAKLGVMLKMDKERNERTIKALRELSGQAGGTDTKKEEVEGEAKEEDGYPTLAFLQNKGDLKGDIERPIGTTTEFAIGQLPALKGLVDRLEPRLHELAEGRNGQEGLVGEEEKTWRRERLEFIEKETKRHLENVRGLELGEMGEVRDGEWQGEGRRLAKGEAEDLERVVGMIADRNNDAMDVGPA